MSIMLQRNFPFAALTKNGFGAFQILDASVTANVATITTFGQHNLAVNDKVLIVGGADPTFNGVVTVTAVAAQNAGGPVNQFTFALVTANRVSTGGLCYAGVIATGRSTICAVPNSGGTGQALTITWSVEYTTAPATVQVDLQASDDGFNWYQLDTYTALTNTERTVTGKSPRFIAYNVIVLTGAGAAVTGLLKIN